MEEASSANEPAIKRSLKPSPSGPIPNFFVSLSSAFTQKTQLARPNKPNLLLLPHVSDSVKLIQHLHRSLASVTEKFSGFFHSFAGRNPLFHEAVRLSSEFRGLCDEVDSMFQIDNCKRFVICPKVEIFFLFYSTLLCLMY